MKHIIVKSGLAAVLAVSAVGLAAAATSGQVQDSDQDVATLNSEPSARIETQFSDFSGSEDNVESLVQGLRTGSTVTLTAEDGSTLTFDVPTSTLGNGGVAISLGLAQQSLADYGITDPTPQELQAALVGGTVTTADGSQAQLAGVLTLRDAGMGWGKIAQTYGVKLGSVVSAIESEHGRVQAEQAEFKEPAQGETHEAAESDQVRGNGAVDADGAVEDAGHGKPEVAEMGNGKPDISRPHVDKPEIERPEIERPHVERPDIERPNIARPDQ